MGGIFKGLVIGFEQMEWSVLLTVSVFVLVAASVAAVIPALRISATCPTSLLRHL
jgi:ABC-type lipoprotein release transport system permease subunit